LLDTLTTGARALIGHDPVMGVRVFANLDDNQPIALVPNRFLTP